MYNLVVSVTVVSVESSSWEDSFFSSTSLQSKEKKEIALCKIMWLVDSSLGQSFLIFRFTDPPTPNSLVLEKK